MTVSLGNIVHYVHSNNNHMAAIVVDTDYRDKGPINEIKTGGKEQQVYVFHPLGKMFSADKVCSYDADMGPGSWHWPEKV